MPSKPPPLRAPQPRKAWDSTRKSRQARGYGRAHDLMREVVLREEPLCRLCKAQGRVTASVIADHIKPLSEGGTGDRENYQGCCAACHKAKTAREAERARRRQM